MDTKYLLYLLTFLSNHDRSEDYHQRAAAQLQTTRGGHDLDDILPDGLRAFRASSVHGRVEEQVREASGAQPDAGRLERVSFAVERSIVRCFTTMWITAFSHAVVVIAKRSTVAPKCFAVECFLWWPFFSADCIILFSDIGWLPSEPLWLR